MNRRLISNQAGVTLIELIIAMIVISIALGGVLLVMNYTTMHSADPVLRHQAIAIAEAYMEEITLKSYHDPDDSLGPPLPDPCPDNESTRDLYDNVCDYNGHSDANAIGQIGSAVSGYAVAVSVQPEDFAFTGNGLKITVTVTDPAGESLSLVGYRTYY